MSGEKVNSILNEAREVTAASAGKIAGTDDMPVKQPAVDTEFEVEPEVKKPAAKKKTASKKKIAAPSEEATVMEATPDSTPVEAVSDELSDELDNIFKNMES